MHNIALLHQCQAEEHLGSVCSNSAEVNADVLAETFDDFAEVHAESGEEEWSENGEGEIGEMDGAQGGG